MAAETTSPGEFPLEHTYLASCGVDEGTRPNRFTEINLCTWDRQNYHLKLRRVDNIREFIGDRHTSQPAAITAAEKNENRKDLRGLDHRTNSVGRRQVSSSAPVPRSKPLHSSSLELGDRQLRLREANTNNHNRRVTSGVSRNATVIVTAQVGKRHWNADRLEGGHTYAVSTQRNSSKSGERVTEVTPHKEDIIPHIDIVPNTDKITPHKGEIIPHKEEIIPNKEQIAPQKREIRPHKGEIIPHKDKIIPHKEEIIPNKEEIPSKGVEIRPISNTTSDDTQSEDAQTIKHQMAGTLRTKYYDQVQGHQAQRGRRTLSNTLLNCSTIDDAFIKYRYRTVDSPPQPPTPEAVQRPWSKQTSLQRSQSTLPHTRLPNDRPSSARASSIVPPSTLSCTRLSRGRPSSSTRTTSTRTSLTWRSHPADSSVDAAYGAVAKVHTPTNSWSLSNLYRSASHKALPATTPTSRFLRTEAWLRGSLTDSFESRLQRRCRERLGGPGSVLTVRDSQDNFLTLLIDIQEKLV